MGPRTRVTRGLATLLAAGLTACASGASPSPRASSPAPSRTPLPDTIAPSTLTGRIAFSSEDDVYVMDADGSHLRRLTTAPGPEFEPSWSPDGTRIAYRDSRRGINRNDEIYVMNADGTGDRTARACGA